VTLPRRLPVRRLAAGAELWRIHARARGPVWFGPAAGAPPQNRFDAPGGEFRVCYFGQSLEAAFVETMVRGRARLMVALTELRARSATAVPLARELRLAQLHSEGLVRLSLSAAAPHADTYADCQRLALSLWSHSDQVDGIEYRSRWDDSLLCVALFERAADALAPAGPSLRLDATSILRPVLRRYGIGVV
jgi:hypothetical protein